MTAEELTDGPQVDGQRIDPSPVDGEDPVPVVGEGGEPVDVLPDALVRGVEEVRPVTVHLDTGGRLGLRVGVAADVAPALQDHDVLVQLRRNPLGHREPEETGAHDDQVGGRQRPSQRGAHRSTWTVAHGARTWHTGQRSLPAGGWCSSRTADMRASSGALTNGVADVTAASARVATPGPVSLRAPRAASRSPADAAVTPALCADSRSCPSTVQAAWSAGLMLWPGQRRQPRMRRRRDGPWRGGPAPRRPASRRC